MTSKALAVADPDAETAFQERLTELAIAANRDDDAARALHAFCQDHPEAWTNFANLEQDAIAGWLALLAPENAREPNKVAWKRDHIEAQLRQRRKALRADGDSQLENLLINRILAAWLMTMEADASYTRFMHKGGTFKEGEYHQKRVERAQRQLLRAVQALATVRRLLGAKPETTNGAIDA